MNTTNFDFRNQYPKLFAISVLFKVLSFLIIIAAIIGVIIGIDSMTYGDELGSILLISSVSSIIVIAVPFFTLSEVIKLLSKIEFNTKKENIQSTIFNKKDSSSQQVTNHISAKTSFDDWKKYNPTKSINDYYSENRKK